MTATRRANAFALAGVLFALGLTGILSMLTMPAPVPKPEGLEVSDAAFKALLLVNPTILLGLAVALGTPAALATGLRAPVVEAALTRGSVGSALRPMIKTAALGAVSTAAVLLAYGAITSAQGLIPDDIAEQAGPNILVRLLYGGITEEVLLRWGVMSILAWLATRVTKSDAAYWTAILLAALLFAAGHLPFLYNTLPDAAPTLVALVMLGNAIPGILFGWLFWKRGIEAAMLAHAGGHLFAWLVGMALA